MKKQSFSILFFLIVCVFIGGVFLGRYYSANSNDAKQAQIAQCNTEFQNWQTRMKQDPNSADFTNIKVYKAVYSQTKKDCVVATYLALPADSTVGEDTEWLEIDSLSTKGVTYWSQTYTYLMTDSEATKILDTQLALLQ